jgi:hypothetical protein
LALAAAAAAPAHATDIALRGGLEAPLISHYSSGSASTTYNFTDSLQPALNVMLSAYPSDFIGFDAEFRYGFAGTGNQPRTGTSIGPGITLNPPVLPLYVRASVPIHLEPGDVFVSLRPAAGLTFNLVVLKLYLEGALEIPVAGNNVDAFKSQIFSLGAGAWLKF